MKVYTKTGDKGTTALISGTRLPKNHIRINAYGSIDELMAYLALLFDSIENSEDKKLLLKIQDRLMTCATKLANDDKKKEIELPQIYESDIKKLEDKIDLYNKSLPLLTNFILPGGHSAISICHIARTICRRCERNVYTVYEQEGECHIVLKYLNRLSDFFFVFARKLNKDLNVDEIPWIPSR